MTWAVELSEAAETELKRLPRDRQALISRAIDRMEQDPFSGNVKPLKGPRWEGRYRRRVGNYRLIFTVDHHTRRVEISAILIRSKGTYR